MTCRLIPLKFETVSDSLFHILPADKYTEAKNNSVLVDVFDLKYESDGHEIKGYVVKPKGEGIFPVIVWNRGGTGEFGSLKRGTAFISLAEIASWGYVVVASDYRRPDTRNTNDVLDLKPVIDGIDFADSTRIGMFGWSRGGTVVYNALRKADWIKCAVSVAGVSDLVRATVHRPEMMTVYKECWGENTPQEMVSQSAINWHEEIMAPLLLLHGTGDKRVMWQDSDDLARAGGFAHRFFEGDDHDLTQNRNEAMKIIKEWFDSYLKEE